MKKQEIKVQFDEKVIIANYEQFEVIKKLLHVKMLTKELIAIRDILVTTHKRAFNSKKS